MPKYPDPPSLTLALAIRDLLEESGLCQSDQQTALGVVGQLVGESAHPYLRVTAPADAASVE
jgi:hypothetical protein